MKICNRHFQVRKGINIHKKESFKPLSSGGCLLIQHNSIYADWYTLLSLKQATVLPFLPLGMCFLSL
jgi:hypothetical protein